MGNGFGGQDEAENAGCVMVEAVEKKKRSKFGGQWAGTDEENRAGTACTK
jgi:hypothetical protein